ncbi:hypothetical protein OH492_11350 [Vibrio chagasii]|nr:hypothetical protein [Vibrio chagasii]
MGLEQETDSCGKRSESRGYKFRHYQSWEALSYGQKTRNDRFYLASIGFCFRSGQPTAGQDYCNYTPQCWRLSKS